METTISPEAVGVDRPTRTRLDILYLTDLRFPGGSSSSLVEETRAAVGAGYRVGVLQCRSSSIRLDRTFHPGIRELLDDGSLLLIGPDEPVDCGVAIVKHPTVMSESMGGRLPIRSGRQVAFIGQVPADLDGTTYYKPSSVHENIIEALGEAPVWCPVSPTVRTHLEGSGVPLAEDDWVEVIDARRWSVDRTGPIGDRPVIGRHGRPSSLKWPDNAEDLLAVYPNDDRAVVRVLGGTEGLDAILGDVPSAWEVLEFGELDPREFLGGVDFFVYFHHPDLVEAFGRTVIEALAAGCVAVLPPHFRELFGDACTYSAPEGVPDLVASIHADPAEFLALSQKGVAAVKREFSHETHVERLRSLVGDPSPAGGRAVPTGRFQDGLWDQRPRVLVSCLGLAPAVVATTIQQVVGHRDLATGFNPVVLTTAAPPEVSVYLDEDLLLEPGRHVFRGSVSGIIVEVIEQRGSYRGDLDWENHVLEKVASVRRTHRITSVAVVDLGHPDAWLALQAST